MSDFDYVNPVKFYFGRGKLAQSGDITAMYGKKALLIASDSAKPTGQLASVEQSLRLAGVEYVFFDEFMQNPLSTLVDSGAKFSREHQCDVIVGIGGGSAMDMAKGIAFMALNDGGIWDYVFGQKPGSAALPMVLIPTTAGTGSEANKTAVFTNPQTNDKKGLVNPLIYPKAAIIDPLLMLTLPKRVIAGPGADVLFHAVESYISKNASPMSEMLSLQAIQLIGMYLPQVYDNPENVDAWDKVTFASTLAGMAIDCAGTTLPHALQHPMGGLLDVVHAEGIAAMYMAFMEFTWRSAPEKFASIAKALGVDIRGLSPEAAAQSSIGAVRSLLDHINMRPSLTSLGVKEEHFDWFINNATTTMRVVLGNNPRVPDADEIREIYQQSL
ncbi:TPA: iron-containing alcohol dehydrogenase [Serratia odorifera]|nr:iron-containing alcohol dehydrogenase [Serratia odorifera]